jgi:glucose-1-phosphate cytidylyltransferase
MLRTNFATDARCTKKNASLTQPSLWPKAAGLKSDPPFNFHMVEFDGSGAVRRLRTSQESEIRINGGYFIFRGEIFEYIRDGEELVLEPFKRLIATGRLMGYKYYEGFWRARDALRDRQVLEEMVERGETPWRPSRVPA